MSVQDRPPQTPDLLPDVHTPRALLATGGTPIVIEDTRQLGSSATKPKA